MSFMHMDATPAASEELVVVTLSGDTSQDYDAFFAQAGFDFRSSGQVWDDSFSGLGQSNPDTDWIIPNDAASGDYFIRVNQIPGGISLTGPTENVWHSLSSSRLWQASCLRFCVEAGSFYADIRYMDGTDPRNNVSSLEDGAPCMASAIYHIFLEAT